jgi:hypothetical protein
VPASYLSRPDRRRKTRRDGSPENHNPDDHPPRPAAPLTPAERNRRLAALRLALADAAPDFHARARGGGEGR